MKEEREMLRKEGRKERHEGSKERRGRREEREVEGREKEIERKGGMSICDSRWPVNCQLERGREERDGVSGGRGGCGGVGKGSGSIEREGRMRVTNKKDKRREGGQLNNNKKKKKEKKKVRRWSGLYIEREDDNKRMEEALVTCWVDNNTPLRMDTASLD